MIQKLKRATDSWKWKLNSKAMIGIVVTLMTIIGGIIGRWTVSVDDRLFRVTEACAENKNEIIPLKTILPKLEKFMEKVDTRLLNLERKH
jgi:hypothetical protein